MGDLRGESPPVRWGQGPLCPAPQPPSPSPPPTNLPRSPAGSVPQNRMPGTSCHWKRQSEEGLQLLGVSLKGGKHWEGDPGVWKSLVLTPWGHLCGLWVTGQDGVPPAKDCGYWVGWGSLLQMTVGKWAGQKPTLQRTMGKWVGCGL